KRHHGGATRYQRLYRSDRGCSRGGRDPIGSRAHRPDPRPIATAPIGPRHRVGHRAVRRVALGPTVAGCQRDRRATAAYARGWWAGRQDSVPLLELMRRGDSMVRSARSVVQLVDARADASLAAAALALARRDTAEALQRFLAFPDSLCAGFYGSLSPSLAPLQ